MFSKPLGLALIDMNLEVVIQANKATHGAASNQRWQLPPRDQVRSQVGDRRPRCTPPGEAESEGPSQAKQEAQPGSESRLSMAGIAVTEAVARSRPRVRMCSGAEGLDSAFPVTNGMGHHTF